MYMRKDNKLMSSTEIKKLVSRICAVICIVCSLLSIAVLVLLVLLSDSGISITSFSLYAGFLTIFYIINSIYNFFPFGFRAKKVFFILSHAFFITIILGTYIPLCLIVFKGGWGWGFFGAIVALAIFGIVMRSIFSYRWRGATETCYYFIINWIWIILIPKVLESIDEKAMILYLTGFLILNISMLFYRLAVYEVNKRYVLFMPLFYFFLILSNICHAVFMFLFLT